MEKISPLGRYKCEYVQTFVHVPKYINQKNDRIGKRNIWRL